MIYKSVQKIKKIDRVVSEKKGRTDGRTNGGEIVGPNSASGRGPKRLLLVFFLGKNWLMCKGPGFQTMHFDIVFWLFICLLIYKELKNCHQADQNFIFFTILISFSQKRVSGENYYFYFCANSAGKWLEFSWTSLICL